MAGPRSTEYRLKQKAAGEMFKDGVTDFKQLALVFGVRTSTIKSWHDKNNWKTRDEEIKALDDEIQKAADETLLKALKEYKKSPTKDLQSLNSMLKSYLERRKPDKKILEYIILFCDQYVNFCIEKGYAEHRKVFQETLTDFAEWARVKNGV